MNGLTLDEPNLLAQLFTPVYIVDPYPVLKQLREHAALIKVPDSPLWLVGSCHETIKLYNKMRSIKSVRAKKMSTCK